MKTTLKAAVITVVGILCTLTITSKVYADDIISIDFSECSFEDNSDSIYSYDFTFGDSTEYVQEYVYDGYYESSYVEVASTSSTIDSSMNNENTYIYNPSIFSYTSDSVPVLNPVETVASEVITNVEAVDTAAVQSLGIELDMGAIEKESYSDIAQRALDAVNAERAKAGVAALRLDSSLMKASQIRVNEVTSSLSHARPNGGQWSTVYYECNVNFSYAGENIAYGESTPEGAVSAWMGSASHRACMLDSSYTHMGIACISVNGCTYWVLDLIG